MRIRKVRYIRQHDSKDCAAACLDSICTKYGLDIPLVHMRELIRVDKNGASMYAISEAARQLGFIPEILQGNLEDFYHGYMTGEIILPVICHMNMDGFEHFVLVKKMNDKNVYVFDPGRGHVRYSREIFSLLWTGYLLTLEKRDELFKQASWCCDDSKIIYKDIIKTFRYDYIRITILSICISIMSICYSYGYKQVINKVMGNRENIAEMLSLLPFLFCAMAICMLVQSLLGLMNDLWLAKVGKRMSLLMAEHFTSKMLRLPFSYYQQWETGEILARYQTLGSVCEAFSITSLTVIFNVIMVIAGMIILILTSNVLFLYVAFMTAAYSLLTLCFRRSIQDVNREIMSKDAEIVSELKSDIDGISVIKLSAMEKISASKIMTQIKRFTESCYRGSIINSFYAESSGLIAGIGTVLILWKGCILILCGKMTVGDLFLFISLMDFFITPVKSLFSIQLKFQETKMSVNRLSDILNATSEENLHQGKLLTDNLKGDIRYEKVSFRYGYRKWVFQDQSFVIKCGERVAFTGNNGSGKSTIAGLLMGKHEPEYGYITIGDHKITDLSLECIRQGVAYASQNAVMLPGTLRENLSHGKYIDFQNKDFLRIVKGCFIDEIIADNPAGYDMIIGENGNNLSGGQRQRISIAGALLCNPDILILDEATSQIDRFHEQEIIDFIFEYCNGKTIIVITHDEWIIQKCDREIVIG